MATILSLIRYYRNGKKNGTALRFEVNNYKQWLKEKKNEWKQKGYFVEETKSPRSTYIEAINKKSGFTVFAIEKVNNQEFERRIMSRDKTKKYTF